MFCSHDLNYSSLFFLAETIFSSKLQILLLANEFPLTSSLIVPGIIHYISVKVLLCTGSVKIYPTCPCKKVYLRGTKADSKSKIKELVLLQIQRQSENDEYGRKIFCPEASV